MTLPNPGTVSDPLTQISLDRLRERFPIAAQDIGTGAVTSAKILDGTIVTGDINASAGITDGQLASPNNSVYHTLLETSAMFTNDVAAGTYILGHGWMHASGGTFSNAFGNAYATPRFIYFDDADYVVGSKTVKLRIRAQVAANATAPAINFTVGLYPLTVAGVADSFTYTAGTVVSGSTVAINTPSASTITSGVGSDMTIPSDGAFVLAVVTSGTLANNAATAVSAQLQVRAT